MKTLMTPTIHLNGTSAKTLREDYRRAMNSVMATIEAVQATAPNGRDYYVKNDVNALRMAQEQHHARVDQLTAVLNELDALYMACIPEDNGSEVD